MSRQFIDPNSLEDESTSPDDDLLESYRLKNQALQRQNKSLTYEKELLDALLAFIPDMVYFKDKDSNFIRVNKAQARFLGLGNADEAIGKSDKDFYPAHTALEFMQDEKEMFANGQSVINKVEFQDKIDDQEIRWTSSTKVPFQDIYGNIAGLVGISRDITLQVKTEEALKRERELLQKLMDNIPDKIYFKDKLSRYTRINKAMAVAIGIADPQKAVGKSDFDFYAKDHALGAYQDEKKVISTGRALIGKEELEVLPSGQQVWVSSTKLPLRDNEGNVVGTFGLSRDITKIKQAEEQLQTANSILAKQVLERTGEIKKANAEMEIRIKQLDYLNMKARHFAQFIERAHLLDAIYDAFSESLNEGEILLWYWDGDDFVHHRVSSKFNKPEIITTCYRAMKALTPGQTQHIFFERNWSRNPRLNSFFSNIPINYPTYSSIPLNTHKKLLGFIQVFANPQFEFLFRQEYAVLNTLAAHAAVSLDNANHYLELKERTRIQSELEIAQRIQNRFLPKDPCIPNFNVKGVCLPANEVGGDYLDFFQNELGDWVTVIADVCGKGVPAALVMTSLRSIIRTEARRQRSSKKLLSAVNQLLIQDLQADNSFITCLCIIIKKGGKSLNFSRAGHPLLISLKQNTTAPEVIASEGVAIGMLAGDDFFSFLEEKTLPVSPGDKFLAYTDGLVEAMTPNRQVYGQERLLSLLTRELKSNPQELVDAILKDVKSFTRRNSQSDDLTLFTLERV